jgi:hypothetical protein
MVEYSLVLGGSLREVWSEQIIPLMDTIRGSPFFWPGIVAVALAVILLTRPHR